MKQLTTLVLASWLALGTAWADDGHPIAHRVKSGETLASIAQVCGTSVEALRNANPAVSARVPTAGETLQIPPSRRWIHYTVNRGDTLFALARRYNAPVDEIVAASGLTETGLEVGQVVVIPRVSEAPVAISSAGTIPSTASRTPVRADIGGPSSRFDDEEPFAATTTRASSDPAPRENARPPAPRAPSATRPTPYPRAATVRPIYTPVRPISTPSNDTPPTEPPASGHVTYVRVSSTPGSTRVAVAGPSVTARRPPPAAPASTPRSSNVSSRASGAADAAVAPPPAAGDPRWVEVRLKDGRRAWAPSGGMIVESRTPASPQHVIEIARQFTGAPYRWGGETPNGADCSGFVEEVFRLGGYKLPRTADVQFTATQQVTAEQMQPGDLVFFTTYEPGPSHVGIYLGDGRFIHASSSRGVTESRLDESYYAQRYLGAHRIADWPVPPPPETQTQPQTQPPSEARDPQPSARQPAPPRQNTERPRPQSEEDPTPP